MNRFLSFFILLVLSNAVNAIDIEDRKSNVLKYEKWFVIEFTLPNAIVYRVGAQSNLPQQQENIFFDISPLRKCKPDSITINKFIGYKQMNLSDMPFLPVKYKISGQDTKDSVSNPEISDGFLFTPISSIDVSELLKAKDKGNLSFWVQPPAESSIPINKMFFPLNGFSKAYAKAIEMCKENM